MAGDLVLALGQREAGEPPHVLGPQAEVGVDAISRHPLTQEGQAPRLQRALRLAPAGAGAGVRGRGEVGRDRQRHRQLLPYFATLRSCWAWVFANALEPDPSPLAMKNR